MRPDDPDLGPARTLWSELYREGTPEPEGVKPEGVQLGMLIMTIRQSRGRREPEPKLNVPKLVKDWEKVAERLPHYPEGAAGNLTLCQSNYERGEIARFYDPALVV